MRPAGVFAYGTWGIDTRHYSMCPGGSIYFDFHLSQVLLLQYYLFIVAETSPIS